ncbi:unnamed protein product [Arctogadus glacialis]
MCQLLFPKCEQEERYSAIPATLPSPRPRKKETNPPTTTSQGREGNSSRCLTDTGMAPYRDSHSREEMDEDVQACIPGSMQTSAREIVLVWVSNLLQEGARRGEGFSFRIQNAERPATSLHPGPLEPELYALPRPHHTHSYPDKRQREPPPVKICCNHHDPVQTVQQGSRPGTQRSTAACAEPQSRHNREHRDEEGRMGG